MSTEKKVGPQRISKTARASIGSRGDAGRLVMCPTHPGRRLCAAILVPPYGRPHAGWICGARGIGNVEADASTHYLLGNLCAWCP